MAHINEEYFGMQGNPNRHGVSHLVQSGSDPGYSYKVVSFSDVLHQKSLKIKQERYIHPGCTVKGKSVSNPEETICGTLIRIVKKGDGTVDYVKVLSNKTSQVADVSADGLKLLK